MIHLFHTSQKLAKQTETIAKQESTIAELQAEVEDLQDQIKQANSIHASDKENAVKEYRKAFVFQRVVIIILALLLALALGIIFVAL